MQIPLEIFHHIYVYCDTSTRGKLHCLNKITHSYVLSCRAPFPLDRTSLLEKWKNPWSYYPIDRVTFSIMYGDTWVQKTPEEILVFDSCHKWAVRSGFPHLIECSTPWCDLCTDYDGNMVAYYQDVFKNIMLDLYNIVSYYITK